MSISRPLRVLAVEPFDGGSHRSFLRAVMRHSRHQWVLVSGKPVHWKWRSRSAPLELALAARDVIDDGPVDLVFCSSMLDLPAWRGMLRGSRVVDVPAVVYFHESQWTYPISPAARTDHHFGYTNLLTAIAADECWFNSDFHRDEFLTASEAFIQRMPDARKVHDFSLLAEKSHLLPPGFDPPDPLPEGGDDAGGEIRIGWVSRWEHDKCPDRLLEIIDHLEEMNLPYRLILLGARPPQPPAALQQLRDRYQHRIQHDGFAESVRDYWRLLRSMDVVVSTADHEFFGIAICEAIWAGATPILPRRLSYPELVDPRSLYDTLEDAVAMIASMRDTDRRQELQTANRCLMEKLQMKYLIQRYDQRLEDLSAISPKSQ